MIYYRGNNSSQNDSNEQRERGENSLPSFSLFLLVSLFFFVKK